MKKSIAETYYTGYIRGVKFFFYNFEFRSGKTFYAMGTTLQKCRKQKNYFVNQLRKDSKMKNSLKLQAEDSKQYTNKNIRDESNDRDVIDMQELVFDIEHLFDAIHALVSDHNDMGNLNHIIGTLAKTGKEKALTMEQHF